MHSHTLRRDLVRNSGECGSWVHLQRASQTIEGASLLHSIRAYVFVYACLAQLLRLSDCAHYNSCGAPFATFLGRRPALSHGLQGRTPPPWSNLLVERFPCYALLHGLQDLISPWDNPLMERSPCAHRERGYTSSGTYPFTDDRFCTPRFGDGTLLVRNSGE